MLAAAFPSRWPFRPPYFSLIPFHENSKITICQVHSFISFLYNNRLVLPSLTLLYWILLVIGSGNIRYEVLNPYLPQLLGLFLAH